MLSMKAGRAVREPIPFAPHGAPVRILWYQNAILPEWSFGYHPEMEIQFVRRGSIVYTVRHKKYVLQPNSLLLIYPNEIHSFNPTREGAAVDKITVIFKAPFAGLRGHGAIPGHRECRQMRLTAAEAGAFVRLAADLQSEADTRAAEWMAMCRLKIRELIVLVQRAASHPVPAEISNPTVARVLDIIERHFSEPIANEALSRAVGLSASRLMHLFAEHMGLSIKQYVLQLRILKAGEMLLAEPGFKVESVAQAVGFKYVADFNRAFKAHHRMAPAEYRALHLATRDGLRDESSATQSGKERLTSKGGA